MSYILDALRKSEQERRQADALVPMPGLTQAIDLPQRRVAPWVVIVAGAVLLAGAAGGFYVLRPSEGTALRANVAEVSTPTVATTAPNQENRTASSVATADSAPAGSAPPPPLELKPQPLLDSAPAHSNARDLAAEAQNESRKPKPLFERSRPVNAAPPSPAETTLAMAVPANEPVKFLNAMPPEFRRGLPELSVNIHIYAPREADRILYINNRQYHTGDRVSDDIVVDAIVEDGAVLSYRGQRFKLPRPQ